MTFKSFIKGMVLATGLIAFILSLMIAFNLPTNSFNFLVRVMIDDLRTNPTFQICIISLWIIFTLISWHISDGGDW